MLRAQIKFAIDYFFSCLILSTSCYNWRRKHFGFVALNFQCAIANVCWCGKIIADLENKICIELLTVDDSITRIYLKHHKNGHNFDGNRNRIKNSRRLLFQLKKTSKLKKLWEGFWDLFLRKMRMHEQKPIQMVITSICKCFTSA